MNKSPEFPPVANRVDSALLESRPLRLNTNYNQLFTVEEAFVRLGQSGQNGELLVLNKDESIQVFVESGFVVKAMGRSEQGEAAVILALNLEAANFVWISDAKPTEKDLHIDIRQFVLRHSLSRDMRIAQSLEAQKKDTLALPKADPGQSGRREKPSISGFYFVTEVDPMGIIPMTKSVMMIGREIYCDWVIDEARMSRKHCVLQVAKRGVLVRDLDTTNGTFINGKLVHDGYLKPGDKLSLGGYVMVLRKENHSRNVAPTIPALAEPMELMAGPVGN